MMKSINIIALLLVCILNVHQIKSKAVGKESSDSFQKDYETFMGSAGHPIYTSKNGKYETLHHSRYVPMIDNRPIYIPMQETTKLESENLSQQVDITYDLDDSNLEQFLKSESQMHTPKDNVLESDEVFLHDKNKERKSPQSSKKKSSSYKYKTKRQYSELQEKIEKDSLNRECKTTNLNYPGVVQMSHQDKTGINCSEYRNDGKESKSSIIRHEDKDKHDIDIDSKLHQSDVIDDRTQTSAYAASKNKNSVVEDRTENSVDDIEGITKNAANVKVKPRSSDIIEDDHLPLQEEVKNMFSPNFKSFVFNPTASSQAKFQDCKTSNNESGICRYVQHCLLPIFLGSIDQFMNNVCIIENRFIGVCCPEFPVHTVPVKWQNNSENIENENNTVVIPKECGVGTSTRIVGGTNSNIKAWPWMVALLNNKKNFFCGGSLINNRYVLTAAHCTFGSRNNEIIARLGEYDLSTDEGVHEDYLVAEIKRHGQYTRLTLRNDIAILKLQKPVVFNEFVNTICLPDADKDYTDEMATLAGWGHIQGGIASSFAAEVLQEASFPVVPNGECAKVHGVPIPPSLICTAAPDKSKSACNGDSGGPLMMLDDENRWKVIGIVSWGRRGCNTKYPSVFTRVSHYLDWIKEHST